MTPERKEELHQLGILTVCQRLHMHNNFTSDPLSPEDYTDYRNYLIEKRNNWDLTRHGQTQDLYDSVVYSLLVVVIAESL